MNLNMQLFRAINGLAGKNAAMDKIMIMFSKVMPIIFMAALAALYFYGVFSKNKKARSAAVNTFVLTVINLILSFAIGLVYFEPRPFVHNKVNLLLPHPADASFPSDHAIGTMSIAVGITKFSRAYGFILFILSCFVGFSRVYVGHHYPGDVIGGFLLVFIVNILYSMFLQRKVKKIYLKLEDALVNRIPALKQWV